MKTLRKWLLYTVVIIGALCAVAHASTAAADQAPCDCPEGTKAAPAEDGKASYAPPPPVFEDRATSMTVPDSLDSTAYPPGPVFLSEDGHAQRTPIIPPGPAPGSPAIVMVELVDQ